MRKDILIDDLWEVWVTWTVKIHVVDPTTLQMRYDHDDDDVLKILCRHEKKCSHLL